jgi:hypothetical protein
MAKEKELTPKESLKLAKEMIFHKHQKLSNSNVKPGALLMYQYKAKNKEETYDKTPLVLVLRRSKGYTLGLNFHWLPMKMRTNLVKHILKVNKKNIKNRKPLDFSYADFKPLLKKYGYAPCIRLYINKRISSKGVVIPETELLQAAKLRTETFTSGRISAEKLYALARKRAKK